MLMNNNFTHAFFGICILFLSVLTGCSESGNLDTFTDTSQSEDDIEISVSPEDPDYMYVDELSPLINTPSAPFIFDVRAKASYAESHIFSALSTPYGETDQVDLDEITGLTHNSEIVTYCGCPRHLSTLMAKHLESLGYENVKVLYEGYWHWKDNNHPIAEGVVATRTSLRFEGKIIDSNGLIEPRNVFIRNNRNGQLEAALSDTKGQFATDFEVLNFKSTDTFSIYVNSLENITIAELSAQPDINNKIAITL